MQHDIIGRAEAMYAVLQNLKFMTLLICLFPKQKKSM